MWVFFYPPFYQSSAWHDFRPVYIIFFMKLDHRFLTFYCRNRLLFCTHFSPFTQGCNRNNFLRGLINFSWFFSWREMLFPGSKFPFWLTQNKQILVVLKSEKREGKKNLKKKILSSFFNLFSFYFSTFPFSIFLLFCSISLASLFLIGK